MEVLGTTPVARKKPRLRGIPHLLAALCALPAVAVLALHAAPGAPTTAALAYGVSLVVLLSVSAFYHTPMWSPATRMAIRRVDRSAIFVLIAGTYTPMCVAIGGNAFTVLLPIVWGGAAVGVLMAVAWVKAPRWATAVPYVLYGWAIMFYAADLYRVTGPGPPTLIGVGGAVYTLGAVTYARRRPDPSPEIFGYHEVFHVLVIVASAIHYAAVWWMVAP